MDKARRATAKKTKSTNQRSAYTAPGIAPTPSKPMSNIQHTEGLFDDWVPAVIEPIERITRLSTEKIINSEKILNSGKRRGYLTADEIFLRDLFNEAKTDPLYQEPNPRTTTAGRRNITGNSFASMVWLPLKDNRGSRAHTTWLAHSWPTFSEYEESKKRLEVLEDTNTMTPDEFFEYMNRATPKVLVSTAVASEVETQAGLKAPVTTLARRNSSLKGSIPELPKWSPPPAFTPGIPLEGSSKYQLQGQENYHDFTANSGSFPPGAQIKSLRDFPARYPMHGKVADAPQFRTEVRYPYPGNAQGQQHGSLTLGQALLPDPKYLVNGVKFRPAETANAAIAQLHGSMSRSQLRSIQQGYFRPNPAPPVGVSTLTHGNAFSQTGYPSQMVPHFNEHGNYILKKANMKAIDNSNDTSQAIPSGSAPRLLNSTRGVYIRSVPPNATLRQICANIRGGAIDRITFHINDTKIDVAVYFVSPDSARRYKHWTNQVGGIWWSPENHAAAFPSFAAFIGPENGGHDRLKDDVRYAVANEGATRCILVTKLSESLTEERLVRDLKNSVYPGTADIESFVSTPHESDGYGGAKWTALIRFASIDAALGAKKLFAEKQVYKGVNVYFSQDECAAPMEDLAIRWNNELYAAQLLKMVDS